MGKSLSQLKSEMRRAEQKSKKAIKDLDRAIDKYNSDVKKYNASVKKSVNEYNRFVRNYNAAVKKNKRIITDEIKKLNSSSSSCTYVVSTRIMQQKYNEVNVLYPVGQEITPEQDRILDLIYQEQANSVITANAIENNELPEENTEDIEIGNKLMAVSVDLNNRWKGAVYALNPANPDAARHFCTSTREIFTEFIEMKAPDAEVFEYNPGCQKTDRGNATRKEKIKYMMRNKDMDDVVVEFAEEDIQNILELFHVLSDGTHGEAGRYEYETLLQVKKRVEQGINFLCEISA